MQPHSQISIFCFSCQVEGYFNYITVDNTIQIPHFQLSFYQMKTVLLVVPVRSAHSDVIRRMLALCLHTLLLFACMNLMCHLCESVIQQSLIDCFAYQCCARYNMFPFTHTRADRITALTVVLILSVRRLSVCPSAFTVKN